MSTICSTCQKPNATLKCGRCHIDICKSCAQPLADDAFSFLTEVAPDLKHSLYCAHCFDDVVAPQLENYNEAMERAKDINVYFKTQSKETRTLSRKEPPVKIADCPDYDEALLRLAFLAAKENFNTLIDVQMISKKHIVKGYQKTIWSASGIPTNATEKQLNHNLKNPN